MLELNPNSNFNLETRPTIQSSQYYRLKNASKQKLHHFNQSDQLQLMGGGP
ncbi:unnamed protein product [Paramecium octaurelia]|uniref:Uncharacterized protein n=1 Tax=Paramecium octaurelia TaxID=43137 RepID=A0A8S1YHQ0_PAROT|nr:unnamed protein product [Paramecium octaurelia]